MCLIAFNWDPQHHYPLIFAANRDEFYQRPASASAHWEQAPHIFGGIDLQAGGTWMGVSQKGRLAAITNYRELGTSGIRSRGELTSRFLASDIPARDYLKNLHNNKHLYAGFNLLLADKNSFWYYSNRDNQQPDVIRQLTPGLYGLSNGLLNTPWPKVQRLKRALQHGLEQELISAQYCIQSLHDQFIPADEQLPNTGVSKEWERLLSPCFVASPHYGTRNSTALILNRAGELLWQEQIYRPGDSNGEFIRETLRMPSDWLKHPAKAANMVI